MEFNPGDKIYHMSLSSVVWIVEKVENDLIYCSTLIRGTLELKKEKFSPTSIKKIAEKDSSGAMLGRRKNSNLG